MFSRLWLYSIRDGSQTLVYECSSDVPMSYGCARNCSISNGKLYFGGICGYEYGKFEIYDVCHPFVFDIDSETLTELEMQVGASSAFALSYFGRAAIMPIPVDRRKDPEFIISVVGGEVYGLAPTW